MKRHLSPLNRKWLKVKSEGEGEDAAEVLDDATADNAGADDKA